MVSDVVARQHDREGDGEDHEDDGGPGGEFGEEVGGAAGAEGGLGALSAEGSGEVCGFALLEEDDADEEEADDDMDEDEQVDHGLGLVPLGCVEMVFWVRFLDWCGGGDLNPYALRR